MCRNDRRCHSPSQDPAVRRAERAVKRAEGEAAAADDRVASLFDATPEELAEAKGTAQTLVDV